VTRAPFDADDGFAVAMASIKASTIVAVTLKICAIMNFQLNYAKIIVFAGIARCWRGVQRDGVEARRCNFLELVTTFAPTGPSGPLTTMRLRDVPSS
jgi:hypothetical protein